MKSQSIVARIAVLVVLIGLCLISASSRPPATLASGMPPVSLKAGATARIFLPLITGGLFARNSVELGAPGDLAVVGEPYTGAVRVISYNPLQWAVTGFRLTETGARGSTAPGISANGTITWTPTRADVGVHHLTVTAVFSDGSALDKAITIEVAPRTLLIAAAVGNEGGVFQMADGDYEITIPPDAVAGDADHIAVGLSVVKRADGSVQLTREFSGLKSDVTPTLTLPMYAISSPDAATLNVAASSASDTCGGLNFIQAFNPDPAKWQGGFVWKFSVPGKEDYLISQNVSNVRLTGRVTLMPFKNKPDLGMTELRGACQDQTTCLGKQPVLFVHGYNPLGQLSGGVETWGCAFDYVKGLGGMPFEFRWRANTRFEDVAYHLAQAIAHVTQLTGRKPLLVAHSMGGLLSTTYLGGLAEMPDATGQAYQVVGYDSAAARGGRKSAAVAGLVTVSSPLSGIATKDEGAEYGLPQGRDTHVTAYTILACDDFTCGESGLSSTQLTYPGFDTDANTTKDYEQVLGFSLGKPGSLVNKLYDAWRTNRLANIHYDVLVSTWYMPTTPDWKDEDYGDGLIAVTGMQVLPTHFVGTGYNYIRTAGRALTPQEKARANIPANLDYTFMLTTTLSTGSYGYPHGSMFNTYAWGRWHVSWSRWYWSDPNPNAPAAIFPNGGRLAYYNDTFDHPLKPVLDRAYASAAAQSPIFTTLPAVPLTVTGTVRQVTQPGSVALPLASAPVLVAFFDQGAYVGMVAGATDAAGAFSIDVGRVLDDYGLADLVNLSLQVRIGNDTTHHAVTTAVGIGQVPAVTELGAIEVNPR